MSKLEELIKEFCPNGVEYKKLTDIASVLYGYPCDAALFNESGKGRPLARIRDVLAGRTNTYSTENVPEKYILSKGDLLVGMDGNFHTAIWQVDNAIICQRVCKIYSKDENILLNGFLFHLLRPLMRQIENNKQSGTVKHLLDKDIKAIVIPLPALPVQREIVRVLDSFTLYSAELTAELTARRKQYEFYRDKLLTFEKTEVKQMPLGKLAKFTYGYTDVAKDVGDARFIRITDINEDGCLSSGNCKYITLNDESKKYLLKEGDLLLARTGATYGKTLYFPNNEPAVYASFLIKIDLDNSVILNRYYWHFSKSNLYWKQADKYVSKAGQQQFNTNAVSRVIVPVPPMEVQERIVKVLDNFDAICSDLGIGLPAEIEKRQKQYEYYRDKLLTF